MTHEEAKSILNLCPPSSEPDREDPRIAAALARLENDEALREWYAAQRTFDARFAEAFGGLAVPESLKDGILSARSAASSEDTAADTATGGETQTRSRAWWRNPWLAAAAVVALLFLIATLPQTPRGGGSAETAATAGVPDVIRFLGERFGSLKTSDFAERGSRFADLETHLKEAGAPTPGEIPEGLGDTPTLGCIVYNYQGTKISMVCFRNTRVYHLTAIPQGPVAEQFAADNAVFETGGMAFRVWRSGGQLLVLSVRGSPEDLPEIRAN